MPEKLNTKPSGNGVMRLIVANALIDDWLTYKEIDAELCKAGYVVSHKTITRILLELTAFPVRNYRLEEKFFRKCNIKIFKLIPV